MKERRNSALRLPFAIPGVSPLLMARQRTLRRDTKKDARQVRGYHADIMAGTLEPQNREALNALQSRSESRSREWDRVDAEFWREYLRATRFPWRELVRRIMRTSRAYIGSHAITRTVRTLLEYVRALQGKAELLIPRPALPELALGHPAHAPPWPRGQNTRGNT